MSRLPIVFNSEGRNLPIKEYEDFISKFGKEFTLQAHISSIVRQLYAIYIDDGDLLHLIFMGGQVRAFEYLLKHEKFSKLIIHHDICIQTRHFFDLSSLPTGFIIDCKSPIIVQEMFDFFIEHRREFATVHHGKQLWIGSNIMAKQVAYITHVFEIYPDVLNDLMKFILF